MSASCKCSTKSKCKTKKCECVKNHSACSSTCSCLNDLCANKLFKENSIAAEINDQLYIRVSNKRNVVLEYRDGLDIYTGLEKEALINPHVDHIIETQMLANSIANNK